jgi:DNA-binding NtrC family response regulator
MSAARVFPSDPGSGAAFNFARFSAVLATVNAALAATGGGDERDRWADALRRLREAVRWRRAVVAGDPPWELTLDTPQLRPAAAEDPALAIAARCASDGCLIVEPSAEVPLSAGLCGALVVRHGRLVLYFEFDTADGLPDELAQRIASRMLQLLAELGYGPSPVAAEPVRGMIGSSPAMKAVFELIQCHADSHAPAYIFGATGTGKERVAKALHDRSPRRHGPFVAVNAATLADELFESQMFGHKKGAFTGAVLDHEGHVAQAEKGTLFLDEIADLSPRAQAKLLRFLDNNRYRPLGDPRERQADIRVISASNKSLEAMVKAGTFREDLFHRINTLRISLPPLHARAGDVPRLARHLLREVAETEGKALPRLSDATWRALEAYGWPANVRELRGEMYRLVVEHAGRIVRPEHLSAHITASAAPGVGPLDQVVSAAARDCIQLALAECRGSKPRAAARLGLTPQGLRGKMKRLGIA